MLTMKAFLRLANQQLRPKNRLRMTKSKMMLKKGNYQPMITSRSLHMQQPVKFPNSLAREAKKLLHLSFTPPSSTKAKTFSLPEVQARMR